MYFKKILLLVALIVSSSCNHPRKGKTVDVKNEISKLKTISDRIEYLNYVLKTDQNIRNGKSSELMIKYGEDSSELQNFYDLMDSIDKLNLKRIKLYLNEFGYPDVNSYSRNAAAAPWIIIQHSTDIKERRGMFPYLYKAYKNKDINGSQMEMYLGRTIEIEYGEYPKSEGAYNETEKIKHYLKILHLKQENM